MLIGGPLLRKIKLESLSLLNLSLRLVNTCTTPLSKIAVLKALTEQLLLDTVLQLLLVCHRALYQFFPSILLDHQQLGRAAVDGTWTESSVSCKAQ
jgi:hypothetical protein